MPGPRSRTAPYLGALAALFNLTLVLVAPAKAADPLRIVAFGDSLVAGYGLPPGESLPTRLQTALTANGHAVEIANAGVSGDTLAAALTRLDWAVPADADGVIIVLGGNDVLRGLAPEQSRGALDQILRRLKERRIPTLLTGMKAPANWGSDYIAAFDPIYPDLAKTYGALLYPFILDGVALDPDFNQADGHHPNAKGVDEIVRRLLPSAEALLGQATARRVAAGKS